ncbi:MAG: hypothetical protein IPK98_03915 [Chloracidobacterium sp.]|nr:hypothetical protein [Chloracidobacterium sp.]
MQPSENDNKTKSGRFYRRPWFWETIVFFLVCWQESVRLSLRTSHATLPVGKVLQDFYYYNFGDFVNGYIMAFIFDGLVDVRTQKTSAQLAVGKFTIRQNLSRSRPLSVSVDNCHFEIGSSSAFTTADLADIPAGVAGFFTCV